jgi:regulator of cell morphogenesis and NO signaling
MKTSSLTLKHEPFEMDLTVIEPAQRHPLVVEHFDALSEGESMVLINDHDAKPLYAELLALRGNVFTWDYIEQGPLRWKVLIEKTAVVEPTIGELVAADIRNADVFKKYGIDFCCGGRKSLREACAEKQLDLSLLEKALKATGEVNDDKISFSFHKWKLDFLADYIYNQHHQYWYNEEPGISQIVEKVAGHHGKQHPALNRVRFLYQILREELNLHFSKEEQVLFPHIKQLSLAEQTNQRPVTSLQNIDEPLAMMQADHEGAGELLRQIREAANDYQLPANACNSFAFMYHKLQSLEADLHQHIHLENNILFPKASVLHKKYFK